MICFLLRHGRAVAAIHALAAKKGVDARHKAGHDVESDEDC